MSDMEHLGPVASNCATLANRQTDRWKDGHRMFGYVMSLLTDKPMGHKAQLSLESGFKNDFIRLLDLGKQLKVIDTIYD